MTNEGRPEGWTENMSAPNDKRANTPEIGGKFHPKLNPQGAQATAEPTGQAAGPNATPEGNQPTQGKGEKYWYDECMKARKQYETVAPLAPYVDVISYLDSNPQAVSLVMGHMKEANPTVITENSDLDLAVNGPTTPVNAAVGGAEPQQPAGGLANADIANELRKQHADYIRDNGIPEHEADQYIKFLMSPGELKPNELFEMYSGLRESRGEPISKNQMPNNNQPNPQPVTSNVAGPIGQPTEMPPMSVAGMSGIEEANDPNKEDEITARARVRTILDPNMM